MKGNDPSVRDGSMAASRATQVSQPRRNVDEGGPEPLRIDEVHALVGNAGVGRLAAQGRLRPSTSTPFVLPAPRPVHRAIDSPRFGGNEELKKADEGKAYIKVGSQGQAVVRIQQALIDAGYPLPKFGVDGRFGKETKDALAAFQKDRGFPAKEQDGVAGPKTMTALSKHFGTYASEAAVAKNQISSIKPTDKEFALGAAPPELTAGTRTLSAADRADVTKAITTEQQVDPSTGKLPTFDKDSPAPGYEARIRAKLDELIDRQFDRLAKGKAALRGDPKNLHDWKDFKGPSDRAKEVTDKVFGNYAVRPALEPNINLFDRWETEEKKIKADPAYAKGVAKWRVRKLLEASDGPISQIDKEHGAIQSRGPERAIIAKVQADIVAAREADLVEIHKAWPGAAAGGTVFLQRFKEGTQEARRQTMWKNFAIIVHEYIHLLEHSNHIRYREKLSDQKGGKVLREGVPDYFKKIVWNDVNFGDVGLQKAVEGPYHDPAHPTDPKTIVFGGRYGEAEDAEQMAGIVGIRNVMAAFFLGRVDLIGGPSGVVP